MHLSKVKLNAYCMYYMQGASGSPCMQSTSDLDGQLQLGGISSACLFLVSGKNLGTQPEKNNLKKGSTTNKNSAHTWHHQGLTLCHIGGC